MKKKVFVLMLFSICATGFLSAQSFGAKAGLNLSSLGGTNRYDYALKPGFHLGGLVDIPIADKMSLQPEALLSFQGSQTWADNINLFYLTIPVLAKYNVWDKVYAEAGPQLGVLLANNIDSDTYVTFNDPTVNTLDIGITFGGGYRLNDNLYFQLRFNPGFVNVVKDYTSKNRVVQISAVYFF